MAHRWLSGDVGLPPGKTSTDGRTFWEEMASHTLCAAVMATGHLRLGQIAQATTGAPVKHTVVCTKAWHACVWMHSALLL